MGRAFAGWKALNIESSLMSGCGYSYDPAKNVPKKLWLKFPELAPSRSGNMSQMRYPNALVTAMGALHTAHMHVLVIVLIAIQKTETVVCCKAIKII